MARNMPRLGKPNRANLPLRSSVRTATVCGGAAGVADAGESDFPKQSSPVRQPRARKKRRMLIIPSETTALKAQIGQRELIDRNVRIGRSEAIG
jgi:hypothetical protein